MLLLIALFPIIMGAILPLLPNSKESKVYTRWVLLSLTVTFILSISLFFSDYGFTSYLNLGEKLVVSFNPDNLAKFFTILASTMWLLVGVYSFRYMGHEHNQRRFYVFYLLSLGAMNGVCLSANYMTLYLFFELLTLLSMPLVLHNQKSDSISAAKKYLIYSIFGASIGLLGFFFMNYFGDTTFIAGGTLNMALIGDNYQFILFVAFVTIVGFGAKCGLFPLHAWLPTAHPVAPAPASAILSGVITKAGVIAIIRILFYQFGYQFLVGTWVQYALLALCLFTVFMGSMLAYKEKILKKRLAYSTVSQVSYILFGLFSFNVISFVGALLHVLAHSLIKNSLFMGAGSIIYRTNYTRCDQIDGLGKFMPWTFGLFTVASLGLVGIPPLLGFVSKWYLAVGALDVLPTLFAMMGPAILLISALLTAGYLLSISISGFLKNSEDTIVFREVELSMLIPMIIMVGGIIIFGLFPGNIINFFKLIAESIL